MPEKLKATPEQLAIIKEYAGKIRIKDLALKLRVSEFKTQNWMKEHNIESNPRSHRYDSVKDESDNFFNVHSVENWIM